MGSFFDMIGDVFGAFFMFILLILSGGKIGF